MQENCWIWHSLINNTVLLNETFTLKVLVKYKLIKYQNTSESWINCLSRNRETESGWLNSFFVFFIFLQLSENFISKFLKKTIENYLMICFKIKPYIKMHLQQVYMCFPSWTLLPPLSPHHLPGSSQCTSPKHPVSCIEPGLATRFIHDILHDSFWYLAKLIQLYKI